MRKDAISLPGDQQAEAVSAFGTSSAGSVAVRETPSPASGIPLPQPIRAYVVHPHDMERRFVCDLVDSIDGLVCAGEAPAPDGRLVAACPDLVLIDAGLVPAHMAALADASAAMADVRYILFERRPGIASLLYALKLPVCGLLSLNHLSVDEFARSLKTISLGGAVLEPVTTRDLIDHLRAAESHEIPASREGAILTQREQEILAFVRAGLANKEIAHRLRISLGTVRSHLRAVFRKLDVTSRTAAAMLAPGNDSAPTRRQAAAETLSTRLAA